MLRRLRDGGRRTQGLARQQRDLERASSHREVGGESGSGVSPLQNIDIGDSAERSPRQSGLAMFENLHEGGPILEDEYMNVFDRVQDRGREVSLA